MTVPAFARELPKVELHCHLEGAARPSTIADRFHYDADTVEDIALDAIEASWAPPDEQAALRERLLGGMAVLREQHGLAPRRT